MHDFHPLKKKIFKKTDLIGQVDKKEKDQTLEKISKLQQATKMSTSKLAKRNGSKFEVALATLLVSMSFLRSINRSGKPLDPSLEL